MCVAEGKNTKNQTKTTSKRTKNQVRSPVELFHCFFVCAVLQLRLAARG